MITNDPRATKRGPGAAMSDPTTPYLKGPGDPLPEKNVPVDQSPTIKDTSSTPRALPTFERRNFGDYDLLEEIARGGMGVVYRARQRSLNRIVALKMILGGRLASDDDITRFRTEAKAAALLRHPNIVSVFEVGTCEGQEFFSMEFIEGTSLSQRLDGGKISGKLAARYLRTIALAIDCAHKNGIIHRDLKPSNILLDRDDQPHVTDFGLAKRIHEERGQTRTGTVLGTPSYMAPEQAMGRTHELGPMSDVYSLGAILYECLTGRPPFKADSTYDTVRQVIQDAPPAPRSFTANVDEDLELICLKCLEKDASLRYASAEELAADLGRYLEGENISARSLNVFDRLTRMLDRSQHDYAFATWSSMLLVMAVVVGVEHLLIYVLLATNQDRPIIFAARFLQFATLGLLFVYHRGRNIWPTTAAERELWSIWIGYFVTYGIGIFVTRTLVHQLGLVVPGEHAERYLVELLPYPFVSLVAGLAFFVMGSNYWGRCYMFGIAFWMAAVIMPFRLSLAPLEFGAVWTVSLAWLGYHLRLLALRAEAERAAIARTEEAPPSALTKKS
jgi:serine/threonine protein kinase